MGSRKHSKKGGRKASRNRQIRRFQRDERDAMASYNRLPFQGRAHRETHVARLAAHTRLYGVDAPATDRCRVLELGCATGDNLVAMAAALPNATFVGIDISDRQIEEARTLVSALGLTNVRLEHLGIAEITPDFGTFDYIIAHGVYSWVPETVRDKVLQVFADNLSENGVAYACYNTYPGWHFRESVRHFLRAHVPGDMPESEAAARARRILERFAGTPMPDDLFARAMAREAELFRDLPDSYLYHELLETDNHALYFKEFLERAREKDLVYITDTEPFTVLLDNLDKPTADWVCDLGDTREDVEQSLDYLYGRTIRHALLARGPKEILAWPDPLAVRSLYVAGSPHPDRQPLPLSDSVPVRFSSSSGKKLGVRSPVSKVALEAVAAAWPKALAFPDLLEQTLSGLAARLPVLPGREEVVSVLEQTLLTGHACGLLDLMDNPVPADRAGVSRPVAGMLARHQVSTGRPFVTNWFHEEIALSEQERRILGMLDGRHDRTALLAAMTEWAGGSKGADVQRELDRILHRLERAALLGAPEGG